MGSAFLLLTLLAIPSHLACTPHPVPPAAPPLTDAAAATAPAAPTDMRGVIGMRFRALPEGLLAVDIVPGLGAEAAGIVPGDLVVAVDGVSLEGLSSDVGRDRIVGPPETAVVLTVQGPLGASARTLSVERRLPPTAPSQPAAPAGRGVASPPEVKALTQAIRRGTAEEARAAATALMAAGFGELAPDEALGAPLRAGLREDRLETTRAALAAMLAHPSEDWRVANTLGQVQQALGDHLAAVKTLSRAELLRPPDYAPNRDGQGGEGGDLGGNSRGRAQLAEAAWDAGQKKRAAEVGRALTRTVPLSSLQGKIGLAPYDPGTPWSATLPPVPEFAVDLLSGERWSLEAQRGKVVLLTFWATWCGPCRKELPELEALWATRQQEDAVFLAISLDDPRKLEEVRAQVEALGVTFPVAHEPSLSEAFGVGPIPAVRVLNRSGALHYAAKGYSPASVERLNAAIQEALDADAAASTTVLGEVWSAQPSALAHFLPVAGATGVWGGGGSPGRVILGVENAAPLFFEGALPAAAEANVEGGAPQEGRILAWSAGPIAADPGDLVVRAWGEDGFDRWMTTLDAPLLDLASSSSSEGVLWVATRAGLRALSPAGVLVQRYDDLVLTDLTTATGTATTAAPAGGGGGVWGLGDGQRWWLPADGSAPQAHGVLAPGYAHIDGNGGVAMGFLEDVVSGRFGPDGATRAVAFREDKVIIGLGGDGRPAFTWRLTQDARLGVADLDGDGHDELLVSFARQGLAVVRLSLP